MSLVATTNMTLTKHPQLALHKHFTPFHTKITEVNLSAFVFRLFHEVPMIGEKSS